MQPGKSKRQLKVPKKMPLRLMLPLHRSEQECEICSRCGRCYKAGIAISLHKRGKCEATLALLVCMASQACKFSAWLAKTLPLTLCGDPDVRLWYSRSSKIALAKALQAKSPSVMRCVSLQDCSSSLTFEICSVRQSAPAVKPTAKKPWSLAINPA